MFWRNEHNWRELDTLEEAGPVGQIRRTKSLSSNTNNNIQTLIIGGRKGLDDENKVKKIISCYQVFINNYNFRIENKTLK